MRYLLILLEVEEEDATELADVMWDWKDADDLPVRGDGASEGEFYTARALKRANLDEDDPEAQPFYAKNGPFGSVEELLELPGMTPQIYYGYNPDEETDPPFFAQRSADDDRSRRPGLHELVTVRTKRLNVNTVGFECLAALCAHAAGDLDTGVALAEEIIDHRQGSRTEGIDNDDAFATLDDLAQVDDMTPELLMVMRDTAALTTTSEWFTVYCEAVLGKPRRAVLVTSKRTRRTKTPARARIVAQCRRRGLIYDTRNFEGELPPGYRGIPYRGLDPSYYTPGMPVTFWLSPSIYFSRWISY